MKIFIAGRQKQKNVIVAKLRQSLLSLGHEITFDWALEENLQPYHQNRLKSIGLANKSKQGAMTADVFILIWDESLYGALIELGMALATSTKIKPKKIYILGEKERICVFEMLPEFSYAATIEQLLNYLKAK